MDVLICERCGGNRFQEEGGARICEFCGTRYEIERKADSIIDLDDDISRLLWKCEREPGNARRYANLILDIDPGNADALRILVERRRYEG